MQKANAVTLRYDRTNKRFEKYVNGKTFRSSRGLLPSDIKQGTNEFIAWFDRTFSPNTAEAENRVLDQMDTLLKSGAQWMDSAIKATDILSGKKPGQKTFDDAGNAWIAFKTGKVSEGEVVRLNTHIGFLTFYVGNVSVDGMTLDKWNEVHGEIWKRIEGTSDTKKKWSDKYANSVLSTIRSFFEWLEITEQIAKVPPFIKAKQYSITVKAKKKKFFTPEEIKAILAECDPERRLWVLLMLNLGGTQKDLSDLTWEMFDPKAGTITRMRGKHEHRSDNDNIPTVCYTLWPEVATTLRKRKRSGDRIFSNEVGKPLVQPKRNDAVGQWFETVTDKLADVVGKGKTCKTFRKTGTTILGGSVNLKVWQDLYLANAPRGTTDRNYDGTTTLPSEVTEFIRSHLKL